MKLIIAGGRDYDNIEEMYKVLSIYYSFVYDEFDLLKPYIHEFVGGGATGADDLGWQLSRNIDMKYKRFPANWKEHGLSAGMIRNKQMAEYGHYLLAFWDGESKGTKNMIDLAKARGLPTNIIYYQKDK